MATVLTLVHNAHQCFEPFLLFAIILIVHLQLEALGAGYFSLTEMLRSS